MSRNDPPKGPAGSSFSEHDASIIAHANDDHADAVLAVARVQGRAPDATAARLLEVAPSALYLEVMENGQARRADVPVDPPIDSFDAIQPSLVKMMHEAYAALDASSKANNDD